MKMAQFARFANNATNQVLGVTGLQLENLQSMFSYPDAINVTDPKLVSGKVIYIEDGAPLYAKRAKVFIEPFQAGSGDPSPSNVRAISGWDGAKINVCGNNIFDPHEIPSNARQSCTVNGNKFVLTVLSDGNYKSSNFEIEGIFEGSTLHLSGAVQNSGNNDGRISVRFMHGNTEINANNRLEISAQTGFSVKEVPHGTTKLFIVCYSTFLNNASTGDKSTFADVVLSMQNELYTPFVNHDYSITFPNEAGTVYGGLLDMAKGVLNVYPYYASYNGETLVGPWVSSMDVYSSSETPTIGAQVVDLGGTPTIYQFTSTNILLFNGINTIYANCGSMELEYYRRESGVNPYV